MLLTTVLVDCTDQPDGVTVAVDASVKLSMCRAGHVLLPDVLNIYGPR